MSRKHGGNVASILLKAGPWVLIAAAAFGWFKAKQAEARAEGRHEVLAAQHDSVLTVLDEERAITLGTVTVIQERIDTLTVLVSDSAVNDVIDQIPDVVVRERVRTVVDTLRTVCLLCQRQVTLLSDALTRETNTHLITRGLLAEERKRGNSWISIGVTAGVSTVYTGQWHVGPGLTFGIQLRIL